MIQKLDTSMMLIKTVEMSVDFSRSVIHSLTVIVLNPYLFSILNVL